MAILPAGAKQSKIARPIIQEKERNESAGNASALPFLLERTKEMMDALFTYPFAKEEIDTFNYLSEINDPNQYLYLEYLDKKANKRRYIDVESLVDDEPKSILREAQKQRKRD